MTKSHRQIQSTVVTEINRLQAEIVSHLTASIINGFRIGELLTKQKAEMAHGDWISWVEDNLTFKRRQASTYMYVFQNREKVQKAMANGQSITHLSEAIALLSAPPSRNFTSLTKVQMSDIDQNPYFELSWLPQDAIHHRKVSIGEMGVYWVQIAVRKVGDRYQLVADHDRWAAMKLSNIAETEIGIVDLSDEQMRRISNHERWGWVGETEFKLRRQQYYEDFDWRQVVDNELAEDVPCCT